MCGQGLRENQGRIAFVKGNYGIIFSDIEKGPIPVDDASPHHGLWLQAMPLDVPVRGTPRSAACGVL